MGCVGIIDNHSEFMDKNVIKVCINKSKKVIYMSREAIPNSKSFDQVIAYKQICIMPMKRDTLIKFNSLKSTPLEKNESIDKKLLRYLTVRVKMFDLNTVYFGKKEDDEKKESIKN